MKRSRLQMALGLLVSLIALALALRGLHWPTLLQVLRQGKLSWILVALLFHFFSYFPRGSRWQHMLRPVAPLPWLPVFGALTIGFLANNVLPARLGEVVRALVLGHRTGVSRSAAFSSVLLERFFDGAATVLLAFLALPLVPLPPVVKSVLWISAVVFLGVFPAYYLLHLWREPVKRWLFQTLERVPERWAGLLKHILEGLSRGVKVLQSPRALLWTTAETLLIWLLEAVSYYAALRAFGVPASVPLTLLAMVDINLSVMIPSAPGYLGVFEYACVLALVPLGVSRELALSFAILSHAIRYVVPNLLGLGFLWKWGLSFTKIQAMNQEA